MKESIRQLHFVGIGGVGMSGIAEVLLNMGYSITGSDLQESVVTQHLESLGAKIFIGHHANHVGHVDAVVTSSAITGGNPEVIEARERDIPVVPRAVMLAELMRLKRGIAVSGTHGKTTTTSLIASILGHAGLDPTFVIGGKLNSAGSNAKLGQGDYIVVEADESDASFLNLLPIVSIITNIDTDHMETYAHDVTRLRMAFVDFAHRLPFYGSVIVCTDDENVNHILPFISRPVISYGLNEKAQFRAVQIVHSGMKTSFIVKRQLKGVVYSDLEIELNLAGTHNVLNALAAVALATWLEVPDKVIKTALSQFTGVARRFSKVGQLLCQDGGYCDLIDDYAHHPVEMRATIQAARLAWPDKRIVSVFQPHRYTRTRDCFQGFVDALSASDVLLISGVYPAGEFPIVGADGETLVKVLQQQGFSNVVYFEKIEDIQKVLYQYAQEGDIVLAMGAGSISRLVHQIGVKDVLR